MARAWASVRAARNIVVSHPKHPSSQKLGQVQNRPTMPFCANATKDAKWLRPILSCASNESQKAVNYPCEVVKNRKMGIEMQICKSPMDGQPGCSRRWAPGRLDGTRIRTIGRIFTLSRSVSTMWDKPSNLAPLLALSLLGAHALQADEPVTPAAIQETVINPAAPPELTSADVNAWLDGFMPYALAQADIAGAVVTVVRDGQTVVNRGYGFADLEHRMPVDPDKTLFRPGSTSKLFTWTAVMQL